MDLICKKQIKDNQPHILVPSLQKLGQSIPSCTHTVIYNKMYVELYMYIINYTLRQDYINFNVHLK